MKPQVTVHIHAETEDLVAKMEIATKCAERLKTALEALNNTEVKIHITSTNQPMKKWYQFWKR